MSRRFSYSGGRLTEISKKLYGKEYHQTSNSEATRIKRLAREEAREKEDEEDKYWIHREKGLLGFKPVAKNKSWWRR